MIYGGEIPGPAVRRPGLRVWRAAYDSAGNVAVLPSRWIAMRETPETIRLLQNMPNPFNPVTTISFTLPQPAHVWLAVYDLWGQEIVRLIDAYRPAGEHSVVWNGRNTQGALIGSGLYLYRFMTKRSRLRER
ncbi:MAG: T9SS type A sorting domain-containing protein [candidate division Zixibacteria bacterium]|nr:T9SS type A sorting domain-containing protein [candidate division Zixibacteria bacterium]